MRVADFSCGSKLGLDATKKLPGEGFKRPWPPLIRRWTSGGFSCEIGKVTVTVMRKPFWLPAIILKQKIAEGLDTLRKELAVPAVILNQNLMKRRTFKQLRAAVQPEHHHSVYVVLLDPAVGKFRKVRAENPKRDPKKPCVYVGMTGRTPEERFANHRAGVKAASVVKRYGIRLLPELYAHLNPMPYDAAVRMEKDLAEDLRRTGYTVTGGH